MAKKSAAKKALGLDPFAAPKSSARLLSIDASTGSEVAPKAKPKTAAASAPTKRSPGAQRKPRAQQGSVSTTAEHSSSQRNEELRTKTPKKQAATKAPPTPSIGNGKGAAAFERMAGDLADRLQSSRATQLSADQLKRIDDLLVQLERANLSGLDRGLTARLAKAWQYFRMYGRSTSVDDFGLDPKFEELVDPIFEFMYSKWWRVETTGMENVPADGRVLLVANHSGMLPWDGGMIKYAVRKEHPSHREVRPLVEDFVYHQPFLGALMARIGGVRASQENAQRLLQKDEAVVVFPEGVKGIAKLYRYRYQLQRFGRGGFVKLCLRTGAPLVPVSVVGAEEIHPIVARADFLARPMNIPVFPITPTFPLLGPLGLIPFPTKWYIQFGKPIDLSRYGKEALDDELLINRITHEVRQQIQEQIYDQLKKRQSVFLG